MKITDYKKIKREKAPLSKLEKLIKQEEKPQGGRPKSVVPRTKVIALRCTSFEKKKIQAIANKTGMNTAEYCRTVALGVQPKFKLTDDELELYNILAEYKTNFSRISNYIQNNQRVSDEVLKVSKAISEQLKMFLK